MTNAEVKTLQRNLNRFVRRFRLKHKWLSLDGDKGPTTNERIRLVKYYLGYKGHPNAIVNDEFLARLKHPFWRMPKYNVSRADWRRGGKRRKARRKALRSPKWSWLWSGSRGVTNEVIFIVNGRVPITSRKRTETFGNPGSDHHVSQVTADAVDFGTVENHALKNEIARKLTNGSRDSVNDFEHFFITRKGRRYRIQMIAATHGTGPHLHVGVRRA
jgi:hypothetical protein